MPERPLFTETFRTFVAQQGAHIDQDEREIHVARELFGVTISCPAAPHPKVPEVDERYHFEPEQARALVQSLAANDRVLLVGPAGSGKSSLVAQLAARLGRPMTRVQLTGHAQTRLRPR